jgi:hypothetical protein
MEMNKRFGELPERILISKLSVKGFYRRDDESISKMIDRIDTLPPPLLFPINIHIT